MQSPTSSPDRRALPRSRRGAPRWTRATLVALLCVGTGLTLTGCDLRLEAAPGALPDLSGVAALRDRSARSEAAALARATSLSAKATRCEECRKALDQVSTDSSARLEALGGLWDPWHGATPEGAEAPAPVADAPVEVGDFATWMALTASRDLEAATDPDIEGPDARLLASAALGRLASAHRLAAGNDVDLATGVTDVGVLDARLTTVLGNDTRHGGGWGLEDLFDGPRTGADLIPGATGAPWDTAGGNADGADGATGTVGPGGNADGAASGAAGPSSGSDGSTDDGASGGTDGQSGGSPDGATAEELGSSAELSAAVRTWDCVAQMMPRAQVVDGRITDASRRADRLLTRASALLDAGVKDTREERCTLRTTDVPTLDALVLGADLDLFTSTSQDVRRRGIALVVDDLDTWLASGDTSPGPLPGTASR